MGPYNGNVVDQPGFRLLTENFVMVVGHFHEDVYCYNKITKEETGIFRFKGDPTCAVVGTNNDWCLAGGDILVLRTFYDRTVRPVGDLRDIYDLRLAGAYSAQILTDPWSTEPAIWQLDINPNHAAPTINLLKVRDFNDFVGKRYEENVSW